MHGIQGRVCIRSELNHSRLKEIFEELSDEDAVPLFKPVYALERSYVIQVVAGACWQTDHGVAAMKGESVERWR